MQKLQEIAHLNKVGASYLAVGNGGSAVKAFKAALVTMSRIAEDPIADGLFGSSQHCAFSSIQVPGLESDSFFIFDQALVFEASSQMDLSFLNAILLLNLALTFHQKARHTGEEAKLRKALNLCRLAGELITDMSFSSGSLYLAALNNQAHIHFELGEYGRATCALQAMEKAASEICFSESPISSPFTQEYFDQIYLNIAVTRAPIAAACA